MCVREREKRVWKVIPVDRNRSSVEVESKCSKMEMFSPEIESTR